MIYQTTKFNQPSSIERLQATKKFSCLYQKTLRNIKNGTCSTKWSFSLLNRSYGFQKSGHIVLVNIDFVYSVLGEYCWTEPHFFKPYSNCNCIHPVGKLDELSSTPSTNSDKQEMICQNCTILASITDIMWRSQVRNANLPNMRNTIDRYKHIDKDNLEFRFAKAIRLIWHKTQRARL